MAAWVLDTLACAAAQNEPQNPQLERGALDMTSGVIAQLGSIVEGDCGQGRSDCKPWTSCKRRSNNCCIRVGMAQTYAESLDGSLGRCSSNEGLSWLPGTAVTAYCEMGQRVHLPWQPSPYSQLKLAQYLNTMSSRKPLRACCCEASLLGNIEKYP